MTTITATNALSTSNTRTESRVPAMFTRLFTLLAAAGRAVPFHRESSWELSGSTGIQDRDFDRAAMELRAISGVREHG